MICIILSILTCIIPFCLSSCEGISEPKLKVAIIVSRTLADKKDTIKKSANQAIKDYGKGNFDIIITSANTTEEYDRKIKEYIAQYEKNDTLIGFVIEGNPKTDLTETIHKQILTGYPVVLIRYDYPKSSRDACVQTDQKLMGKLLANSIIQSGTQDKPIIILANTNKNFKQRLSALKAELKQFPTVKIVKTINTNSESAPKTLKKLLDDYPKLYAIASTTSELYSPKYKKILKNFHGKIFAIADTTPAIDSLRTGKTSSLIAENLYTQIYLATTLCLERLEGQIIKHPEPLKPIVLTRENLDKYNVGHQLECINR